ncbi:molybdopterin-dependent oxidoreductase [Mesorhizobium muleiense]|uniref:molybdopterin-containing oxidoreductase family protein n=1 Tax=Mesorhizobium muleiense TaxID=1004279 RepID=UPI002E2EFD0B|nr:molybdopterin-dependent oxidoreductase [Mesorhizobium muleiense]
MIRMAKSSSVSPEQVVNTVCAHNCGGRSRLACTVRNGVLVRVEPAPAPDDAYTGLCVRCLTLPQWVYSKERIKTPMRRVGPRGSGQFVPISWDEALDEIVDRFNALIYAHGSSSIAFVRSTSASPIASYTRLASLLGGGGTSNFYGGVDMAVHMGLNSTFGDKGMYGQHSNEWTDRLNSKLTIVWGHNPAETAMTAMHHLLNARDAGCQVVVIDPRYSATAMHANWWIAPRPGSDLALALGLLHVLIAEGLIDRPFLFDHSCAPFLVRTDSGKYFRSGDASTSEKPSAPQVWDLHSGRAVELNSTAAPALEGRFEVNGVSVATAFTLLTDSVAKYTPSQVAELTGLDASDIVDLARTYAKAGPAQIGLGYGVDRYKHSELFARAAAAIAIVTGNIGKPGAGVGVQSHYHGSHPARLGPGPALPKWASTKPVPMIEVGRRDLPVRAVFCQGDWINQRMGDMNTSLAYLKTLEFVVTVDHFFQTTTQWSDIVLPACTFLEDNSAARDALVFGNSIYLRPKVIDPVGEARTDFEIERDLARRFGLGEWFRESSEDVVRGQIDGARDPAFDNITYDQVVQAGGAIRLNVPTTPHVQYGNYGFTTKSGRAEFYIEELAELGEALPAFVADHEALLTHALAERYPMLLVQTHARQRAHSTFFNTAWTLEIWPEPILEMNPDDARQRGLANGEMAEAYNDRGHVVARVVCNPDFPPGMCNITEGWKQQQYADGNVQELTNSEINAGQTLIWGHANIPFFDTRVEIRPAALKRQGAEA